MIILRALLLVIAAFFLAGGTDDTSNDPSSPLLRAEKFATDAEAGVIAAIVTLLNDDLPSVRYDTIDSNFEVLGGAKLMAQADYNGDGLTDLIAGGGGALGDMNPLVLLLSNGDGTLRNGTSEIILGDARPVLPNIERAVTGDFNGDSKPDAAVFDLGFKPPGAPNFVGSPPILLLSNADGKLEVSTALADAVEEYNINESGNDPLCVGCPFSGRNVGARIATTVDVNHDGNLDIFVESTGSENITSHFYINNGDGTFVIDHNNRLTENAHFNHQNFTSGEFWRHYSSIFVDVNNDEFPDLVMGQSTGDDGLNIFDGGSLLFINDGNGFFPVGNRTLLSNPDFNGGFTEAHAIVAVGLNDDGHTDLAIAHARSHTFTGRYIQVLINNGDGQFTDETATHMGDQSATRPMMDPYHGGPLGNVARQMYINDIDQDGNVDLIAAHNASLSPASPLIYLNDGSGHFTAQDTDVFTGGDLYIGEGAVPIDLNNDGRIDFVSTDVQPGLDGVYGTADDMYNFPTFVAVPVP